MIRAWLLLALILFAARFGAAEAAVQAEHGMVVSAQRYASEVGVRILAQGGNAIDAAVAVGYALAVVDPCCGNIGGGGFMTIHLKDGRDTFINFRETAPGAATAAMYLDAAGKPIFNQTIEFRDRTTADRFNEMVIALVRAADPTFPNGGES